MKMKWDLPLPLVYGTQQDCPDSVCRQLRQLPVRRDGMRAHNLMTSQVRRLVFNLLNPNYRMRQ
jgi:hypothetical protein